MNAAPVLLYVGSLYVALGLFVTFIALLERWRLGAPWSSAMGSVLGGGLALLLGLGVLRFGLA